MAKQGTRQARTEWAVDFGKGPLGGLAVATDAQHAAAMNSTGAGRILQRTVVTYTTAWTSPEADESNCECESLPADFSVGIDHHPRCPARRSASEADDDYQECEWCQDRVHTLSRDGLCDGCCACIESRSRCEARADASRSGGAAGRM
jgi:hypothetical protein